MKIALSSCYPPSTLRPSRRDETAKQNRVSELALLPKKNNLRSSSNSKSFYMGSLRSTKFKYKILNRTHPHHLSINLLRTNAKRVDLMMSSLRLRKNIIDLTEIDFVVFTKSPGLAPSPL